MSSEVPSNSLSHNKLFRNSLMTTAVAILACLSTHLLTIVGVTVAVAWFDAIEHALVVAVIGGAGLTLYAVHRHRQCCHVRVDE